MVNIKIPAHPVQKRGLWPPKGGREYTVLDIDDWWKIAAREHLDVWDLIRFNFQTSNPEEVNYYLGELVGCSHSKDGGRNYAFLGADPRKSKIYLPISPPPPPPPIPRKDQIKKLKYEVEHSFDPQKPRFLCILDSLLNDGDDRVILWPDVAPDDTGVVPMGVEKLIKPIHDADWLSKRIKSIRDIDAMPSGNGMPSYDTIVTSTTKYLLDGWSPTIFYLRDLSNMIASTHENLDRWSNVGMGGSTAMPPYYLAIRDFVRRQESTPNSVYTCVVTTGAQWPT